MATGSAFTRHAVPRTPPALELRAMTADRQQDEALESDVANLPGHGGRFLAKLLGAWIAMAFRRPRMPAFATLDA